MAGCAAANESARRTSTDLAAEWQAFVGRRINADLRLMQEVCAAKAPDEVWNVWLRFWQKAVEDYGAERSAMAKLAAGFVPDVRPGVADDDGQARPPQARAAA